MLWPRSSKNFRNRARNSALVILENTKSSIAIGKIVGRSEPLQKILDLGWRETTLHQEFRTGCPLLRSRRDRLSTVFPGIDALHLGLPGRISHSRQLGFDSAQAQLLPDPVNSESARHPAADEALGETLFALPALAGAFNQYGSYRPALETASSELAFELRPAVLALRQQPQANRPRRIKRIGFAQNSLSSAAARSGC